MSYSKVYPCIHSIFMLRVALLYCTTFIDICNMLVVVMGWHTVFPCISTSLYNMTVISNLDFTSILEKSI